MSILNIISLLDRVFLVRFFCLLRKGVRYLRLSRGLERIFVRRYVFPWDGGPIFDPYQCGVAGTTFVIGSLLSLGMVVHTSRHVYVRLRYNNMFSSQ